MINRHISSAIKAVNRSSRRNRISFRLQELSLFIKKNPGSDQAISFDPSNEENSDEEDIIEKYVDSMEAIADILQSTNCPQNLTINFEDSWGLFVLIPIINALQKKNYLKTLQLYLGYSPEISLEGAQAIADMLMSEHCPHDLVIDLEETSIDERGVDIIIKALALNTSVIEFNLKLTKEKSDLITQYCLRNFSKKYSQLELLLKDLIYQYCLRNLKNSLKKHPQLELLLKELKSIDISNISEDIESIDPFEIDIFNIPEELKTIDPFEIDISNISEDICRKQITWINTLLNSKERPEWLENAGEKKLATLANRLEKKLSLYPVLLNSLKNIIDTKNFNLVKKAILCQSKKFGLAECLDIVSEDKFGILDESIALKLQELSEKMSEIFFRMKKFMVPEPTLTKEESNAITKFIEPLHLVVSSLDGEVQKVAYTWQRRRILERFSEIDGFPTKDKINKIMLEPDWMSLSKSSLINHQKKPSFLVDLHKAQRKRPSEDNHYAEIRLNR